MATLKTVKKVAKKAVTKAAAKAAPATPAAKKAVTKAAPAAERQVDEQNGIRRPRAGGNTGNVWEACDKLYAKKKQSCPAYTEVDAYIETKHPHIPQATRRANYSAWRRYNGITGRVTV